ncbi:MAG: hypothetical protein HOQ05_10875 [Corynebacteriales bacterium]|nr:hypothetical protein [Mycobacteriales bacterium]
MTSCTHAREALSAQMDGAEPEHDPAAHLATCRPCQAWHADAQRLNRLVRLRPIEVPDLTERILAAVHADPAIARQAQAIKGRRQTLRIALALSALVQLCLAIPLLLGGHVSGLPGMEPIDAARTSWEMASFEIAVAVGYLCVAAKPARAAALVPMAVVLSLCLLLVGVRDVATDPTSFAHNVGHVLVLVQAGLLVALARLTPQSSRIGAGVAA